MRKRNPFCRPSRPQELRLTARLFWQRPYGGEKMNVTHKKYRLRLRFRVVKMLRTSEAEITFEVAGHAVRLTSTQKDGPLDKATWLVMHARGFKSKKAADAFAEQLKLSLQISAASRSMGVDCGADNATASLGKKIRQQIYEQSGIDVRPNIHGIDVFEDVGNVGFANIEATASILVEPTPILDGINAFFPSVAKMSQRGKDILLLLNWSLMNQEPVARILFAVSAVEMLGQGEKWSDAQKKAIARLKESALKDKDVTPSEANEVAEAVDRMHKVGLIQGVVRLLKSLGLGHLEKAWKTLYKERSTLVHGLAPQPGADYSDLARRTILLCGHILLTAIAKETGGMETYLETYFRTDEL